MRWVRRIFRKQQAIEEAIPVPDIGGRLLIDRSILLVTGRLYPIFQLLFTEHLPVSINFIPALRQRFFYGCESIEELLFLDVIAG